MKEFKIAQTTKTNKSDLSDSMCMAMFILKNRFYIINLKKQGQRKQVEIFNKGEKIMERVITVKGIGKATATPDYIVISMNLQTQENDYEETLEVAANKIEQLNNSLKEIGFEKSR